MGLRRILECLWEKCSGWPDLPSEKEIRQRAASLAEKHENHDTIDTKNREIQELFKGIISVIIIESPNTIKTKD